MSQKRKLRRTAVRQTLGQTPASTDPLERMRQRLEAVVAEYGAAGGTIEGAMLTLLRAAATCAHMTSTVQRAAFSEHAAVAFDEELAALRCLAQRHGDRN